MRELRARMTTREMAEWMAIDKIEPFGDRRADYHAALIAYCVTSALAASAGSKTTLDLEHFLLDFTGELAEARERASHKSVEESIALVENLNRMFGGKDLRE